MVFNKARGGVLVIVLVALVLSGAVAIPTTVHLVVEASPNQGGVVYTSGEIFARGAIAKMQPIPNTGYVFRLGSWAPVDNLPMCTFVEDGPDNIIYVNMTPPFGFMCGFKALFSQPNNCNLFVYPNYDNRGTITGSSGNLPCPSGYIYPISATPRPGYRFERWVGWELDDCDPWDIYDSNTTVAFYSSEDNSCSLVALFVPI